jgi:hypothetical protein
VICTHPTIPNRLEHDVRKAHVEDLVQTHLAQEVIDPIQLRLVDESMELRGQCARGLEVVAKRLLDHDACLSWQQPRVGEAFDHQREEARRNLEAEHRTAHRPEVLFDPAEDRAVGEVAAHVRQAGGQPLENPPIDDLAGGLDRSACVVAETLDAPVLESHADDRTAEQSATLEPVQRPERHLPCQVSGDTEDDQRVGCGSGRRTPFLLRFAHRDHEPWKPDTTPRSIATGGAPRADSRSGSPDANVL